MTRLTVIMPPEVDGAYWFRVVRPSLSVRASVHQKPCVLGFWNFIYDFLMEKYWAHIFFLVEVISLSGVMPFWIKSKWNLMHAISYEPCMLGFGNFIYGFLVEKKLTHIFFLVRVASLSGVMRLWKNRNLDSKISWKVFELGFWNLVSW